MACVSRVGADDARVLPQRYCCRTQVACRGSAPVLQGCRCKQNQQTEEARKDRTAIQQVRETG